MAGDRRTQHRPGSPMGRAPCDSSNRERPPQHVEGMLWSPPLSPAPPCPSSLGRLSGLTPAAGRGAHSPDWDPSFSPTRAWSPSLQRSCVVSLFEASLSSFSSRYLNLLNSCTVSLIHLLILEYWPPDVPTQAFPGEFSVVISSMAIDIISSVSGVCSTSPFSSERVEFTCCSLFCEKREAPLPSPRPHAELSLGGPPNAS